MIKNFLSGFFKAIGLMLVLSVCFAQLEFSACAVEAESTSMLSGKAVQLEIEDGEYTVDVTMEGGSGKSTIYSPAILIVKNGYAYAQIKWSSSNYDYIKVDNKKYLPINKEGYSTFEIPIIVFDKPMSIIGDTTAMSIPHEVEYTLTFAMDSISSKEQFSQTAVQKMVCTITTVLVLCAVVFLISNKRRGLKK